MQATYKERKQIVLNITSSTVYNHANSRLREIQRKLENITITIIATRDNLSCTHVNENSM